jgi:hypothetical protein
MVLCEGKTAKGTPCKRHACRNDKFCYAHVHKEDISKGSKIRKKSKSEEYKSVEEKPVRKSTSKKTKCLFSECKTNASYETPNGKCYAKHKEMYKLEKPSECAICFCKIQEGEKPLNCGHWFHKGCIMQCIKLSCPICRADIRLSDTDFREWKNLHPSSGSQRRQTEQPQNRPVYQEDVPYISIEMIRDIIPSLRNEYSIDFLPYLTTMICAVYPEITFTPNPEEFVYLLLLSNGITFFVNF